MKAFVVEDFAALIGIDWADKKHDICELSNNSDEHLLSMISTSPQTIHQWASKLESRYLNQLVAVGCELKTGPLIEVVN